MKAVIVLALCTIGCLCAQPAFSQETVGHLRGRLLDQENNPVSLARVIVTGSSMQGARSDISLRDGYFYVMALPIGSYSVQLVHISYQQSRIEDVPIRLGTYTDLGDIHLTEQVFEAREILVSGKAPMIDVESAAYGGNLVAKEYTELPIDRNYRDMTTLLPHINESALGDPANHAGGTGWENKFFIDGADVTEPFMGEASTELPYNFVREVRVKTGGYQAEYVGAMGGIVDVITHSGSNTVTGRAFGFYRNDRMAAEPRLALTDPDVGSFTEYDFGGSIGGPLKQDKLWYFLSYNPRFATEEVEVPGIGLKDFESITHCFATKLTWRLNNSNDVELSVFGDPMSAEGVGGRIGWLDVPTSLENADPLLAELRRGGINGLLKGRHFLHERFLLQSQISLGRYRNDKVPLTALGRDELFFVDTETGIWSGGSPFVFETTGLVGNLDLKGTLILGDHELKTGVGYNHVELDMHQRNEAISRYYDPTDGEFYRWYTLEYEGTVGSRTPSAFIQDSWRIQDMLRLNFGLRWDGQYIMNSSGEVGQRFLNQWQPRAGLAYRFGDRGTHRIFGSYGRFYQNIALAAASLYFTSGGVYRIALYDHDPRLDPVIGPGDTMLIDTIHEITEETDGLEGQHYDEFTLGYEHRLTLNSKVFIRGIYRTLRNGLEDAYSESAGEFYWGNPGSGDLSEFPEMKREYTALELTLQRTGARRFNFLVSYVLSRNTGNHPGVFPSDYGDTWANASAQYDVLESFFGGDGLLPNDRTHVFKFSGSHRIGRGVTAGTSFFWMSGTPLNEFGSAMLDPFYTIFIVPRGEAGRTPSIWDLNLRLTYDMAALWDVSVKPRVILDLLHIASRREPVNFVQRHYLGRDDDENHVMPNPLYGEPTAYQPPFAVRLGLEVGF